MLQFIDEKEYIAEFFDVFLERTDLTSFPTGPKIYMGVRVGVGKKNEKVETGTRTLKNPPPFESACTQCLSHSLDGLDFRWLFSRLLCLP